MNTHLRHNIHVEFITQIDRINVVALRSDHKNERDYFQVAIHDCEEDLHEEVDCIDDHAEQVEPCFACRLVLYMRCCTCHCERMDGRRMC